MDWQKEIRKFKRLRQEELELFAPPGEMKQAVFTYNKAIGLLESGSDDIALIALRKLAATYPMFAQAAVLLGCCLMVQGHVKEAIDHFDHARLLDLPEQEHSQTQTYLAQANDIIQADRPDDTSPSNPRRTVPAIRRRMPSGEKTKTTASKSKSAASARGSSSVVPQTGAPILQRSGRHGRVRMANEKEKREVARRVDFPDDQETHIVYKADPFDYLRKLLPIAGGILIALLLAGGGILVGMQLRNHKDSSPNEHQRLVWLEERLAELSSDDERIAGLLDQYDRFANPPVESDPTGSEQMSEGTADPNESTTQTAPTTAPTTVVTETTLSAAEQAVIQLRSLADLLELTLERQTEDVVAAAESLQLIQAGLNELPAQTAIEDDPAEPGGEPVIRTAGELLEKTDDLMQTIGQKAADELRIEARKLFDRSEFTSSLILYEKAYGFYPLAYGGGVAYYCGRCHQELDQYEQARPYFEFVIENFSGRELAGHAANRLRMMGY